MISTMVVKDIFTISPSARSSFTLVEHMGQLSAAEKQTYHPLKMIAGKSYVIEMSSTDWKALDPLLRLLDQDGKVVAENDDISYPANMDSRIMFTPSASGAYRIVATSFLQRGIGVYTITIREFAVKKE